MSTKTIGDFEDTITQLREIVESVDEAGRSLLSNVEQTQDHIDDLLKEHRVMQATADRALEDLKTLLWRMKTGWIPMMGLIPHTTTASMSSVETELQRIIDALAEVVN